MEPRPPSDAERVAEVGALRERVRAWAGAHAEVRAVGLAGSWARGDARQDSDVDLVVLTDRPDTLADGAPPWGFLPDGAVDVRTRRWGVLLERRFRLPSGLEVECGLAPPSWAGVPVDPGTARVLTDGFVVLHDPSGLLGRLVEAVAGSS